MEWIGPAIFVIAVVLFLVIRPIVRVRRLMQVHRSLGLQMKREARLCLKCGYDVRHVMGEVCPECGWRIGQEP